jgi:hypothetical protein
MLSRDRQFIIRRCVYQNHNCKTHFNMNRIFLFAALFSFHLSAQESLTSVPIALPDDIPADFSRWQIGVSFSPDLAYRRLSSDPSWINDDESPIFGYTTGGNVVFNINDRFGTASGVHFSEKGYGNRVTITNAEAEEVGKGFVRTAFDYIEIPLKASYTFGSGSLRWTAGAGIVNGILVSARQVSSYTIEVQGSKKNKMDILSYYDRYNFSVMLGAGIDWSVASRLQLKAEPTLRYGLTKISQAPFATSLWNVGLDVGLYYGL